MRTVFSLLILAILLPSCSLLKSATSRKAIKIRREVAHSSTFSKAFTGFTVLDPSTGKTLVDVQGDHLFTPASNTKILTLATCLAVLGDSIPGIKMASQVEDGETIGYYAPTGDPTFLHPQFQAWQPVVQHFKALQGWNYLFVNTLQDQRFGPGWAWDDYYEPYSAERAALPIFGNKMTIVKKDSDWELLPSVLDDAINGIREGVLLNQAPDKPLREEFSNLIYVPLVDTLPVDYRQDFPLLNPDKYFGILRDTIGANIYPFVSWTEEEKTTENNLLKNLNWTTRYSTPIDTVLRRMMHQSDNFIAEQMLLVSAGVKFNLLNQDTIIHWMLDSILTTLPQHPRWVDGSGLSRYNLISPQDIAQVLFHLWKTESRDRLFSLFPAGGVNGTIENYYAGKAGKPYVFAKTGTMSGVHSLSGYLICKSGKVLIFSFMHNNYTGDNEPWKLEMQRILELLTQLE